MIVCVRKCERKRGRKRDRKSVCEREREKKPKSSTHFRGWIIKILALLSNMFSVVTKHVFGQLRFHFFFYQNQQQSTSANKHVLRHTFSLLFLVVSNIFAFFLLRSRIVETVKFTASFLFVTSSLLLQKVLLEINYSHCL